MLENIKKAVADGCRNYVRELIPKALEAGIPPERILSDGLLAGMNAAAAASSTDDGDIVRLLVSSKCMTMGIEMLRPYLPEVHAAGSSEVILGTISGDLHDIGKNLVNVLMVSAGFTIIDLGVDVSRKQFLKAVQDHPSATIVAISCLLTTSIPELAKTVDALNELKKTRPLVIMVGGACLSSDTAAKIGADVYTESAYEAAEAAVRAITLANGDKA